MLQVLATIIVLQLLCGTTSARVDWTLNATRVGSGVVRAVLAKIHASDIFNTSDSDWWTNDQRSKRALQFLRQMAYVETDDGLSLSTGQGIWNVNKSTFSDTRIHLECDSESHAVNPIRYNMLHSRILRIDWCDSINYSNLSVPIYSGLAVALYVDYQKATLPISDNTRLWIQFWQNFNHEGSADTWKKKVDELKNKERKCITQVNLYKHTFCQSNESLHGSH